jgi:hypothetical protein
MSAIDAVHKLTERYAKAGKNIQIFKCWLSSVAALRTMLLILISLRTLLTKWCLIKKQTWWKFKSVFFKNFCSIKRSRNHIPWEMELRITWHRVTLSWSIRNSLFITYHHLASVQYFWYRKVYRLSRDREDFAVKCIKQHLISIETELEGSPKIKLT